MRERKQLFPRLRLVIQELGFIPASFRCTVNEAAFLCGVGHEEIRQQLKDGKLVPVYSSVGRVIGKGKKPPKPRPMILYGSLMAMQEEESKRVHGEQVIKNERVMQLLNTKPRSWAS